MRFEYADARMPFAMTKNGTLYYLAYDQVGSLRVVADGSGNAVKQIDYDSFGNIFNDSAPGFAVPFGFAGGLYDKDTKLVRFGYRDYDPDTGRWTAKDPIGFAGGDSDLYGYCVNDPVNWVDPCGLECDCPEVPPAPPGVNIDDNIGEADGQLDPFWFYNKVKNKGPWDYKQKGKQYQDFGNFNYGATGLSFGFFPNVLPRMAGWAQQKAGTSKPEWGNPWGFSPYGDDPHDQEMIRKGMEYYRCKQRCGCQ